VSCVDDPKTVFNMKITLICHIDIHVRLYSGNCNAWVHIICSGVTVDDPSVPSYKFNCLVCVKQRKDFAH